MAAGSCWLPWRQEEAVSSRRLFFPPVSSVFVESCSAAPGHLRPPQSLRSQCLFHFLNEKMQIQPPATLPFAPAHHHQSSVFTVMQRMKSCHFYFQGWKFNHENLTIQSLLQPPTPPTLCHMTTRVALRGNMAIIQWLDLLALLPPQIPGREVYWERHRHATTTSSSSNSSSTSPGKWPRPHPSCHCQCDHQPIPKKICIKLSLTLIFIKGNLPRDRTVNSFSLEAQWPSKA